MTDSRALIADSIDRIFGDVVDRQALALMEQGGLPGGLWSLVEANGFHRLLDGEANGAPDWSDAEPVLFALGYHRVPLPLAETLVANWLSARAGLPLDDAPATLVDGTRLAFDSTGGQVRVTGTVARVPWARHCQRLFVAGHLDGRPVVGTVHHAAPGLAIEHDHNLAGEPRDRLTFSGTPLGTVVVAPPLPDRPVHLYGALARATAMAGAASSVLDQSVQYVNDRQQFGRALAKFQAVQHLLAEMGSEAAAGATAATAACAAAGGPAEVLEIAVAKVRAGQMAAQVARAAHQVHGAMGFTHEYPLHFGTRRLWSWRQEFGGDASWAQRIGAAAIAAGGDRFWSELMVGAP